MASERSVGGKVSLGIGIVAAVLFLLGPAIAASGAVTAMTGFAFFRLAALLALVGLGVSAVAAKRHGVSSAGPGLALGIVLVVGFFAAAMPGCGLPLINDITTDPAQPLEFVRAGELPGNEGRDMSYPGESFAVAQREAYPDVTPARIAASPEAVFAAAERIARETPHWELTRVDAERREIEGFATSRIFRFKDDFVIAVREEDGGSLVQMRSKSRDGKGDLGVNANRIREYLARLREAVPQS